MQNARKLRLALAASTLLAGSALTAPAFADGPNVVTTIKPVHSIAAAVMAGVGTPHILIDGAASPHGFALKPSQAFLLQGADVVFWVGPELSSSLEKPISSMADKAAHVELLDVEGIEQLKWREGDQFDSHDHGEQDDHGHDDHADHGHDDHAHDHEKTAEKHDNGHDDHDHDKDHAHDDDAHEHEEEHAAHDDHDEHAHEEEHAEHDDHGHDHGHDHAGGNDPHIWLNPENGIAIANAMATTLSEVDPTNADTYQANAKAFAEKVSGLEAEISAKLEPVKGQKFVVFHDAYHHFEHHYDIEASGAITVTPEALASAEQVAEIQSRVRDQNIVCVFREPQFDSKLVNVVIEGSNAKVGVLDPLGTELANGPDLYPALLTGLADSLADCLKS
ncbi:zinc ABC transporter substrate-binding protein [Roseibium alexandrii]|uniref:High-affinity zinc uptake system protein ZnuA n=1 Tax=Roseibium alexandrii (strain DSM 17067 / NCIMB 14079 / DFL-11) TaxID=244592 RepID=A0A5E8GWY6_ROSAD|nr:zinc ABC transporter substrate-binding protein [Roseibium alexandrii]EEE43854.1 ABC-type Zn2+ transport system, periplasmic component/surface adhesin [Roseibium alexandrii DFL-11]